MVDNREPISWEGPEHRHVENSGDWFWALGIVTLCGAVAAFFFGNFLFSILIIISAVVMALRSVKPPKVVPFMVANRGVRVGEQLFTYSELESYRVYDVEDEEPQLYLKSKKIHMPLIVLAIPEEYVESIEALLSERLPEEEELEEPLGQKILELFGF